MSLGPEQIQMLVNAVASTEPDPLDCDSCYEQIAEFAELNLAGKTLPEAMHAVSAHLRNCPCCQNEYEILLEALSALEE